MNPTVKLVLYVVLTLALAMLGYGLVSTLQAPTTPPPRASTPAAAASTATNNSPTISATSPGQTNATTTLTAPTPPPAGDDDDITVRRSSRNLGRATGYGVAMFFVFIALAILIARDVSRYIGSRAQDLIFNDNLEGMKDPEYEEAERVWAKGDHLESVRLMRAYLNKHPREQYVALRIAEIYETNLRNYLAAALEYEEVLKRNADELGLSLADVDELLNAICARAEEWPLQPGWQPVLADADDEPLVQLAYESRAGRIVSHNVRHLRPAAALAVDVLKPREFLAMLRPS